MIKVKIKKTGEVKEVTRNEAHGLIESGVAVLYKEQTKKTTKVMQAEDTKGYKTK